MALDDSTALQLFRLIERRGPEYLDLLTAESESQFETAFTSVLEKSVVHLEENSKHFKDLDEEALTAILKGSLSMPGVTVETERNSNGHVDLTIALDHCTPARKKLGEAKIYDGPAKHLARLEQLLGRYTTGREGRGLLIAYVRKQGIATLITKLRERMDKDLPQSQCGATADHLLKWSFLSKHSHTCGEDLEVEHIACNLYITN